MSSTIRQLATDHSARIYQCDHCSRGFSRQDHLNRHIRTHTHERPYSCTTCAKSFARADLLRRHETHHLDRKSGALLDSNPGRRVSQACKSCASSKLKCSHGKPCIRCVRKGISCDYDPPTETLQQLSSGNSNHESNSDFDEADQAVYGERQNGNAPHTPLSPISDYSLLHRQSLEHVAPHQSDVNIPAADSTYTVPSDALQSIAEFCDCSKNGIDSHANPNGSSCNDTIIGNMDTVTFNYSELLKDILGSGAATPMNMGLSAGMEIANDFWDQHLGTGTNTENMENFLFPEIFNAVGQNFEMTGEDIDSENSNAHLTPSFEETTSSAGPKAFKDSGWEWGPTTKDCTLAGHPSLILPAGLAGSEEMTSSHSRRNLPRLTLADRHRILSLLLNHCEKETWVRIASSFPSVSALESMLQKFLVTEGEDSLSWFHLSSFKHGNIRDELLTAMVAFGACLTPNESVQRFGFAIPEILRYAVVESWSQDNSTSRDIQLLQTWLIIAILSFRSGDKRQMEIGEGNFQPLITIIRRARWLRNEQYKCIHPELEEEGETLFHKWQLWTEQEIKKRLIYRAFVLDAQISMMNHVNSSMSYVEMRVPMPEADELWFARTAEAWKDQYFKQYQQTLMSSLTLTNAIQVILTGQDFPQQGFTPTSSLFILYGFWNLVWEYQQLQETLNLGESHETSILLLPPRREMLMKALNSLRLQTESSVEILASQKVEESMLVLEYLCMALHVPLQGLQAFAGRDGEQEARRIYPSLQEWVQTRVARQALWHAGQVYGLSKKNLSRSIRNQHLMLVYQASITFWAYGMITSVSPIVTRSRLPPQHSNSAGNIKSRKIVLLDGDNNAAVRKFITISEGEPALSNSPLLNSLVGEDSESQCLVEDASATMMLAVDILNQPFSHDNVAQNPLIKSVTCLMKEIAKVAKVIQPG